MSSRASLDRLTQRQQQAWPEAIARLSRHASVPANFGDWTVTFHEETRLGRGHFIDAIWLDGEVFAQIQMDVYGQPSVSIASLTLIHSDHDEECVCSPCQEEAAEDAAVDAAHVGTPR